MEKSIFVKRKNEIKEKISQLKEEEKQLREEYISTNAEFSYGDKVIITSPQLESWNGKLIPEVKRIAFISGFEINYSNDVVPKLFKSKKNGEPSQYKDHLMNNEVVSKFEP